MFTLLFRIGAVFLVVGAADFMLQKKLYMKQMKMSKYDVQKEYKDEEGDPNIKHMRHQLHEELLANAMVEKVPKADAVVVNPTHLAIAIEYDEGSMNAPLVTAKGQRTIAERIIAIAREHRVPIVRNVPLAHSLFAVEIGGEIPEDLYEAVAEVLNWVYQLAEEQAPQ
jgi:flagellar biosynthetic protein FlhB